MPPSEAESPSSNEQAPESWELASQTARFACNGLSGEVSLTDPSGGITHLAFNESAITGSLWASAEIATPAAESYQRGTDFVQTLPATEKFPCETIWYWTVRPLQSCPGALIRLTLSMQTDQLDSSPSLMLSSTLAGDKESSLMPEGRCLAQQAGAWRCIEVVHPSDQAEVTRQHSSQQAAPTLCVTLPFLEKGVIRRTRMAALFVPDGIDQTTLDQAVAEFVEEPLPLTT